MSRRRRPRLPWEQGGGVPGSLSGPPLPPEAFTGAGGRRIHQRRHGRRPSSRDWHAPAWLVPAIFSCILLGLVIIIVVTA
jgi:hypothetical protein